MNMSCWQLLDFRYLWFGLNTASHAGKEGKDFSLLEWNKPRGCFGRAYAALCCCFHEIGLLEVYSESMTRHWSWAELEVKKFGGDVLF